MMRRWMHWSCIAAAAVVYLIAVSTAAPVVKDEAAISDINTAEKPLVRTKRADEIIFNGQQEADGIRIKKSDETPKSDDVSNSISDMDSEKKTTESPKDAAAVDVKEATENGGQEVNQKETEQDEAYDSTGSEKQSTYDSSEDGERVGGRVWDEEDDYGSEQRRRRRAAASSAVESKATVGRQERSAGQPVVAMVAENMASPAVSMSGGGALLQRNKRELDADTIRELIESRQQALAPSNDERPLYDYSDYGAVAGEYAVDQSPEDVVVEAGESAPGGIEEGLYVRGDNVDDYFTEDDRRPKRRDDEDEQVEEEEAEEEEAYEEAEREVVRELLAERAAEETRQALLAYLSGGPNLDSGREYRRGGGGRYDQDDDVDDEENSYAEDEDNEGDEVEDDGEIDENDDRMEPGPFLPNEGSEIMTKPSSIEQKRFTYPYTYEPYGGRWGALVPGAKRSDRDPYDRLYRLAEALSRPAAIGQEEYK